VKGRIRGISGAAALLAVTLISLGAGPVEAPEIKENRCHGRRPTIEGTDGPDVLRGTPGRDVIWGGPGDDEIFGSLGNDLICGGPGSDLIHGGRGNDILDGGPGDGDRVIGDLGDDTVLGGAGNEDEVAGDLGIDTLNGGPGNYDLVHGDYGYDRMDGGSGYGDIASFATDVGAGRDGGVWVDLAEHRARGDGHDRLFRFESIEGSAFDDVLIGDKQSNAIDGGPGNDKLYGGGGRDELDGGAGSDGCKGAKGRTVSCGKERRPKASAFVEVDRTRGGGGGIELTGLGGPDDFTLAYDTETTTLEIEAMKGIAVGAGCARAGPDLVFCSFGGPARWLTADLGPGDDRLTVKGSLAAIGGVRLAGGPGDDTIRGGPEDDLIEAGFGADRLYGGGGADGLIGSVPGPTFLYGGKGGDLLAAGGGCAGGALVGGPGRDDASFAETQAHPGLLYVSFPRHEAWIDAVPGCHPVRLAASDEDMEGSFDDDVLIGNGRRNSILGQPGADRIYGGGGEDVLDARDGVRDVVVQCSARRRAVHGHGIRPRAGGARTAPHQTAATPGATAGSRALIDPIDPAPVGCADVVYGHPVPGLGKTGEHHPSR
jgi:Ca2+-binding RTX toxin-like protein